MFRKSQAALEFLTTYAWAFLVILVMVGALAYFGVLNPSGLLPDRCNFGSEISCSDFKIGLSSLNLRLKNSLGEPIVVDAYSIGSESSTVYTCSSAPSISFTWSTGEVRDFAWSGCNGASIGFVDGEKGKISISITYHLAKSSDIYSHEVNGEVFSTVN